jgi:hypothetical protein
MKLKTIVWALGIVLIGFTQACKKDAASDADTQAASDNAYAEASFNDVYTMVDDASRQHPGIYKTDDNQMALLSGCTKVTVDSTGKPHKITLDFGTGCVGNDGRTRTGQIVITYTGRYRDSGTVITATLVNYTVTDLGSTYANKIEGTKTITNLGHNSKGHPMIEIKVTGAKVTTASGSATWACDRTREWAAGYNTPFNIWDDVYLVTGNASGTNIKGVSYTADVVTPLQFAVGCHWIESGVLNLTPSGMATRTIDFGNGTCDANATVTISGHQYPIVMR